MRSSDRRALTSADISCAIAARARGELLPLLLFAGLALLGSELLGVGCNKILDRLAFRAEALLELHELDVWGGEREFVLGGLGWRFEGARAGKGP